MDKIKTYFKEKTKRDPKYLEFIQYMPCLICGQASEAHHEPLNGRGMGLKGPDNETLPLCRLHHSERHNTGRTAFYNGYGVHWRYEIVKLQALYILGQSKPESESFEG